LDIGKRLKQLRNKNDLTLEDLASRCELTKGFLSQLENNLTSPSISTLQDICEVLGVSLPDFFQEEEERKVTYRKKDFFVDEKDLSKLTWLVPDSQGNEMEPVLLELKENGSSKHIDPFQGEAFGYVLSGRFILEYGEEELELKKGESFYLKGERSHRLLNKGNSVAQIIWVISPPVL